MIAHGDEPSALELGRAVLSACGTLDDERRELYTEVVLSYVNAAARRALEAEMSFERMETRSQYLREQWDRAEAKGREEGRAEARAHAAVVTLARAVLVVLDARGIRVSEDQRAAVLACSDPTVLDGWLARAATVDTADGLFAV